MIWASGATLLILLDLLDLLVLVELVVGSLVVSVVGMDVGGHTQTRERRGQRGRRVSGGSKQEGWAGAVCGTQAVFFVWALKRSRQAFAGSKRLGRRLDVDTSHECCYI